VVDSKILQAVKILRRSQRKGIHWWRLERGSRDAGMWCAAALRVGQVGAPVWYYKKDPVRAAQLAVQHALQAPTVQTPKPDGNP
jgi:hypothetical protein